MSYTPRMLAAWMEVHSRVEAHGRADFIGDVSMGSNPGKGTRASVKKLREML